MSKPTSKGALSLGALGTALSLALSKDEDLKKDAECMPKLVNMTSQVIEDDGKLKYNSWNGHWLSNSPSNSSYTPTAYKTITTDSILLGGFVDKLKDFIKEQHKDIQDNLASLADKANNAKTSTEKVSIMQNMQYWLGYKNALKQSQSFVEENQTVSI